MKSNVRCVVLLCLLAAPARGQTGAAFDCETNAACAARLTQAQQQSRTGQLGEAEKNYKLAYEVSHDARLLFNIARVLDKRGQESEAITYYRRFIEAPLTEEEQKAKAKTYVEQIEAQVAARKVIPTVPLPSTIATSTSPAVTPTPSGEQNMTPVTVVASPPPAMTASTSPPVEPTPNGEQNGKPVYKKGWFWGVVLGSVAVVGLGLGLGLSQRTPTLPGETNVYEPSF